MSKEFFKILGASRNSHSIRVQGGASVAKRLREAGERVRVNGDNTVEVLDADDRTVSRVFDGLLKALILTPDGTVLLVDNPNSPTSLFNLAKRDCGVRTPAGAIHASLRPYCTGPMNPGPLGRVAKAAIAPRYRTADQIAEDTTSNRASTLVKFIHGLGAANQRGERYDAIRRAIAKCAQTTFATEAGAKTALRKNLRAEGFDADELASFGLL
jgi:hypothetical protein